jgi:hypothetical protein
MPSAHVAAHLIESLARAVLDGDQPDRGFEGAQALRFPVWTFLDGRPERDDTLIIYVVGDNGPSGEGSLTGTLNT